MNFFLYTISRQALVAAIFTCISISQAHALDADVLRDDADAGNTAAQRILGEALVFGTDGLAKDASAGIAYLERAAANGDVEAQAILGALLLDGVFLDQDPVRGKDLLEKAATAGNTAATAKLGAAFLWGTAIEQDTTRAAELLSRAAESGDIQSKSTLGEALIVGLVQPKDVQAGLRMMEEAADTGDAGAQIALGSLLLNGQGVPSDIYRATALFEDAARAGNGEGLEELGSYLMWSKRRTGPAEEYLRRAAELGRLSAWDTLAAGAMYGYLGEKQRRRFEEFAARARDVGSERIEVLDAERHLWGITKKASGPTAIAMLQRAADQGNREALLSLIALVRNGNDYNVRKRPAQARSYLERFADQLTPAEIEYFEFSIDAAQTLTGSGFARLMDRYQAQDQTVRATFAEDLYAANPNLVIYILQGDMKERGEYRGRLNGLATQSTINALNRACKTLPYNLDCKENALKPGVIRDLLSR